MPLESSPNGLEEKSARIPSRKEKIFCEKCGSEQVHRVFREGFLQESVYPSFGYFPWRCKTCGKLMMLRKRHKRLLM